MLGVLEFLRELKRAAAYELRRGFALVDRAAVDRVGDPNAVAFQASASQVELVEFHARLTDEGSTPGVFVPGRGLTNEEDTRANWTVRWDAARVRLGAEVATVHAARVARVTRLSPLI
jgi:hypothetical protein